MVAHAPQMRPPWRLTTRIAARMVAAGFRLLPRAARFRAALIVARLFAWPIALLMVRRVVDTPTCGGAVDQSLRVMLRLLTWSGVRFDPIVVAEGDLDRSGIFVSGHFPLNALFTRALHDRGIRPLTLKARPEMDTLTWGTDLADDAVTPSASVFVTFRHVLAEGRPVILEIDSGSVTKRTVPLDDRQISTSIFELAHRLRAPLSFFAVVENGMRPPQIIIREICGWSTPCCDTSASCTAKFLSFLQSCSRPPARRRTISPTRR